MMHLRFCDLFPVHIPTQTADGIFSFAGNIDVVRGIDGRWTLLRGTTPVVPMHTHPDAREAIFLGIVLGLIPANMELRVR